MAIYKSDIVDVELERGNISRNFLAHSIGLMDNAADRFGVRVFRNGTPVDLTGCSCQGFFRNADGTNIALTSYGTVDGNTAFVTLPQACYNVDGQFCLSIKLIGGGVTGTMRIVDGIVDNTHASGTVAPTESVPTYQEIIAQYDAMVEATEAAQAAAQNEAVAVTFDVTEAYTAGTYVMYDGKLYRLTADHAANVSWNSTQKVQVNLGDELNDKTNTIQNEIDITTNTIQNEIDITNSKTDIGKISLSWTDGAFINDNNAISTHGSCSYCDYVEIPANCVTVIRTYMRAALRTIVYNEDKSVLEKYNNMDAVYPDIGYTIIISKSKLKRFARISTYTEFKADVFMMASIPASDVMAQIGERITNDSSVLTDCDDALPNRIYTIVQAITNCPNGRTGTLLTFNGAASYSAGQAQVFVSRYGEVYTRILWSDAWTDWQNVASDANALIEIGTRVTRENNVLTDCDNALPNRVYTIVQKIDNCPNDRTGTLLTFNGASSYTAGQAQIYVTNYGDIFTRMRWGGDGGTWTSWQKGITDSIEYSGIGLFERVGVIGDSFASGTIYTPGVTEDHTYYNLSWGQILARQAGITCVNYSRGGYNTYDFVQSGNAHYNTRGLGKVLSDISGGNACGLYLLCLGINDSNNTKTFGDKTGGLNYLGSSADINSDPTQNANSFWGNYGRIISAIQTASPASRIIMCTFKRNPTTATAEGYEPFRTAITEIAAYFSLPCIQLDDDSFFNSSFYMGQMVGSHPTGPQYVGYAKAMERLISGAMVDYYDYFKEYIGIQ